MSIQKLQGAAGILVLALIALASGPALANGEHGALNEGNTA